MKISHFLLGALALMSFAAHGRNLIQKLTVEGSSALFIIEPELKKRYLNDDFYIVYDPKDVDLTTLPRSVVNMPFILNIISIVWASGKTYEIDEMDEDLYNSLQKIHDVFVKMYPSVGWTGKLVPKKIVKNQPPKLVDATQNTALFYSGGLDSMVTSERLSNKNQLLVTIWGNTDWPPNREDVWLEAKNRVKHFAKKHNHTTAFIKSNFWFFLKKDYLNFLTPEIHSWRLGAVEGLGWAGMAAPLMYAKGYPLINIGSSISWDFPAKIASAPIFDDAMHFAGMRMHQDAFELTRLEKFEYLRDVSKAKGVAVPKLKVCNSLGNKNCNRCLKCTQTITELLIIGENPVDYGFVVDEKDLERRTKKFIGKRRYPKNRVWHYWCMQKRIQERRARGEKVSHYLTWLSETTVPYKREIEYRSFMGSFPWYQRVEFTE